MTDASINQVHLADAPLVLLKGRNLFGIRRPHEHCAIAVRPARIVRGIAKIFHAIGRQLSLFAGRDVTHPEVEIENERGALFVRRKNVNRSSTTTTASSLSGR